MIDTKFWQEVKDRWFLEASVQTTEALEEPLQTAKVLEEPSQAEKVFAEPPKPVRPHLNTEAFDAYLEKGTIPAYVEAGRLLLPCELPAKMEEIYRELIERMSVLQETMKKFEDVYHADVDEFSEYYIPEALNLTAAYLEYRDIGVGERVMEETEREILQAAGKLLNAVNDKIEEIYKFASIEVKAKAKALDAMMSQDGYVDEKYRM